MAAAGFLAAPAAHGQQGAQPVDTQYTRIIRELTPTDPRWKFTTELVNYLPASGTVPTPLKVLGYVPGTVGKLTHVADVNRYFRELAKASPRTRLFSLGKSDEDREELLMAIADEQTLARLDDYKGMLRQLADPRGLDSATKARLVREAKPVYWVLGAIHSPETGSPEMLMEMAYRLAVDEGENARAIRSNVITLITPVQEVDGRDRMVDVYNQSKALKLGVAGANIIYWGKYTAHDNNRDGMVASQRITQNYLNGFLEWRPTIAHDLHESVPFMYISTGTGPYNDEIDPITVNEWHTLAYNEMTELTRRGLPGVWTHGFYDGWGANYMMSIVQFHNSTGRFYETYTSSGADCHNVQLPATQTGKEWFRPSPPVNGVRWCIRSNVNYQQSGVLLALRYVGDHRQTFLENFLAKGERMVARGKQVAPYAFVIPKVQRHAAEAADLVALLRRMATEVQVATSDFTVTSGPKPVEDRGPESAGGPPRRAAGEPPLPDAERRAGVTPGSDSASRAQTSATPTPNDSAAQRPGAGRGGRGARNAAAPITVHAGDYIVRMDQPYTQYARTIFAVQRYKADDPSPYDDTGWTLDELRHVVSYTIPDSSVLTKPMQPLGAEPKVAGTVRGTGPVMLVKHLGDWRSALLPWKAAGKVSVADTAFAADGQTYPAGTFIVDGARARDAVQALGLEGVMVAGAPTVRSHAISVPRIALVHTWQETQNEGWVRFAFDQMGVPFTYVSDQKLKNPGALDRFDVVVFPHSGQGGMGIVNGRPMVGPPIPWKKTAATPHLGMWDATDDMRPGMGLEGAAALRKFVERGGLLLVEGATARLPIELGFTPGVTEFQSRTLGARGAVFRGVKVTTASPILYGYDDRQSFPVYFNQTPLLQVGNAFGGGRFGANTEGVDTAVINEQRRMQPRVILKFHDQADSLGVSGMLNNPQDLVGRPAVVDAPLGSGHVVMFAIRPLWRHETQGSWALALNAIANWNNLTTPPPPAPAAGGPVAAPAGQ
jgi:hypothetical protein